MTGMSPDYIGIKALNRNSIASATGRDLIVARKSLSAVGCLAYRISNVCFTQVRPGAMKAIANLLFRSAE